MFWHGNLWRWSTGIIVIGCNKKKLVSLFCIRIRNPMLYDIRCNAQFNIQYLIWFQSCNTIKFVLSPRNTNIFSVVTSKWESFQRRIFRVGCPGTVGDFLQTIKVIIWKFSIRLAQLHLSHLIFHKSQLKTNEANVTAPTLLKIFK